MKDMMILIRVFKCVLFGIPVAAAVATLIWGRHTLNTWQTWFLILMIPILLWQMWRP